MGLGVGYQLAMKDLDIRGAGTLLGEKQSGHLTSIGFDLYCKLLEKNLKKVRGQMVHNDALISLKDVPIDFFTFFKASISKSITFFPIFV